MSIALALQARSQPAADWHSQLLRMHQEREQERLQRRRLQHTLANRSAAAARRQQVQQLERPVSRGLVPAARAHHT